MLRDKRQQNYEQLDLFANNETRKIRVELAYKARLIEKASEQK